MHRSSRKARTSPALVSAASARAKRSAHRDFFPARRRSREQEIRHVRTGDKEDEPDGPEENPERELQIAPGDLLKHGNDLDAVTPAQEIRGDVGSVARRAADVGRPDPRDDQYPHGRTTASG